MAAVTKKQKNLKIILSFVLTAFVLLAVFYWSVLVGGIEVTPIQLFRGLFVEYDYDVAVIFDLRFPRIIVAMVGGAMMAVAGVLMQAVMRNPLAEPGIIGINSGAALFAALFVAFFPDLSSFASIASFAGGLVAFGLVYMLAWNKRLNPLRLILVGVAIDIMFEGLSEVFTSATGGNYSGSTSIIEANITLKSWTDVRDLAIFAAIGLIAAFLCAKRCNLLALSDETVSSLGINVGRSRIVISVVSVFLASVFTAIIGPVSFLGLIVPHMARLLVGNEHRLLIPYSALLGAVVFLLADTIGRVIAYPYEIGAGVVMAVIGGPAFIILLRSNKKAYGG